MALKVRNPGAGRRQGFDVEIDLQATLDLENSPNTRISQSLAVRRLTARFNLPPSTAALVVELAGWRS